MNKIDEIVEEIITLIERIKMLESEADETMQGVTNYIGNARGNLRDAAYELEMVKSNEPNRSHCEKCKFGASYHCPCLTCMHDDGRDGDCCIRHCKRCDADECPEYEKED